MSATPPLSRARSLAGRCAVALVVLLFAALLADVVWRSQRWHADLESVRFVDHREKIAGNAAAVSVVGYLVATVRSDVDFFALAHADGAHPRVLATLCDSGTALDAWPAPWPRDVRASAQPFGYAVLIPMRGAKVDLATTSSDSVCLRFQAATGTPLSWVKSKAVVVPIGSALRAELASYARRDGTVELVMDEACTPTLCQPDFSAKDLRP